jgi:hypothetical protein
MMRHSTAETGGTDRKFPIRVKTCVTLTELWTMLVEIDV